MFYHGVLLRGYLHICLLNNVLVMLQLRFTAESTYRHGCCLVFLIKKIFSKNIKKQRQLILSKIKSML